MKLQYVQVSPLLLRYIARSMIEHQYGPSVVEHGHAVSLYEEWLSYILIDPHILRRPAAERFRGKTGKPCVLVYI